MSPNSAPDRSSEPRKPLPSPFVPWWVVVLLVAIAVGAHVVLVVIGGQDSGSTAGSLGALLTGMLAVLGIGRRT